LRRSRYRNNCARRHRSVSLWQATAGGEGEDARDGGDDGVEVAEGEDRGIGGDGGEGGDDCGVGGEDGDGGEGGGEEEDGGEEAGDDGEAGGLVGVAGGKDGEEADGGEGGGGGGVVHEEEDYGGFHFCSFLCESHGTLGETDSRESNISERDDLLAYSLRKFGFRGRNVPSLARSAVAARARPPAA